jgi:tetratricopeptide (TPR) repeat protein
VDSSQICPKCGRVILHGSQATLGLRGSQGTLGPEGHLVCRCSARSRRYWLHSRETILLLCVLGLILAFAITGFAAKLYHGRRAQLARSWMDRGNAELKAGHAAAALSDFHAALVYAHREFSPEEQERFELDFVQALLAAGDRDEARSYLLDMYERAPGNSRVNLELARMAAQMGDDADAKRYYNGAIYGVWDENPDDVLRSRLDTRLELYRYLADRGEKAEAQSVLLATAAAVPPDPALHVQVGQLMLQAGQPQAALDEFERALRLAPRDYEALAGAGQAYFQLGNDQQAVRFLESATREAAQQKRRPGQKTDQQTDSAGRESEKAQVFHDLVIAEAALVLNPHAPGLDPTERARRAVRAYDTAMARMRSCASQHGIALPRPSVNLTPFTRAASEELAEAALARHIEQLDSLMAFVYKMESAATQNCGPPVDPTNVAIVRIGGKTQATP